MHQKRLGDIASYVNGYAFKPEQRGKVGLPIIRIQDLTGNVYDLGFYDGDYPKKVEINDGDVLISWSASLGVYEWNRGKALLNQHIFKVVFDKLTVDKKFFMYAVQCKLKEMESKTHGATMKHITKKDFDNTVIPFPTIVEQERISNTLNKLHTIIDSKKFQLEKLDSLIKARFVEMFKDCIESVKLEQVVTSIKTGKLDANAEKKDGKYPFFTCDATPKRIDDYVFDTEAILISGNGSRVGHVHYYKGKFNAYQRTYVLSDFRHDVDLSYLKTYLENELRPYIARNKKGSAVPYITLPMLQNFKLPFPPLEKQKEFATFVAQVDKSKFTLSNELAMGNFYIRLIHDCIMHGCIDL